MVDHNAGDKHQGRNAMIAPRPSSERRPPVRGVSTRREAVMDQGGKEDRSEGRLRALTSKLRHPLPDVRERAISNLSGKLSLGLLSAADFAADVHFFTDIVALLFQAAPLPSTTFASGREHSPKSSSNRYPVDLSSERSSEVGADGSQGGGTATVIASGVGDFGGRIDSTRADDGRVTTLLLSLCAQLVKDSGCRAHLAREGAAGPLLRIAEALNKRADLSRLAAEILAVLEAVPLSEMGHPKSERILEEVDVPKSTGKEGYGATAVLPPTPQRNASVKTAGAWERKEVDAVQNGATPEGISRAEALSLYGDGSEPRWPRWTKELVDGPSLASENTSVPTLVASLKAGWRFPPVRLVRSEESLLFDFEVRFRTASTEARLLGCVQFLKDQILEDFPPEVLLQRSGSIGRLVALMRAPSASDRVLEEALCTAKRLLEGLVCSARLHLDESFLPPRSGTEGAGINSTGEGVVHGYGHASVAEAARRDRELAERGAVRGHGVSLEQCAFLPGGNRGDGGGEDGRNWRDEAFMTANYRSRETGNTLEPPSKQREMVVRVGQAAVASLLSYRYPQSTLVRTSMASMTEEAAALGSESPDARFATLDRSDSRGRGWRGGTWGGDDERRQAFVEREEEEGEGLSVCGALFALFLSAYPLLTSSKPSEVVEDDVNSYEHREADEGTRGIASGLRDARFRRRDSSGVPWSPATLMGADDGSSAPPGVPSRVAILAAELCQDIIPFLVEPALFATGLGATPSHDPETQGMRDEDHEADQAPERSAAFVGQEERCIPSKSACSGPRGWDGESSFTSGLACRVDALRVGEALCSVGRTLAESLDLSAMVKEGTVQDPTNRNTLGEIPRRRNRGDAGGVPNPLVTVALQLLFVLSPTDLCSERRDSYVDNDGSLLVRLPQGLMDLVRGLVLDPILAEEQPWVRARLRPYFATVDPVGAERLQAAQDLAAHALSVVDMGEGSSDDDGETSAQEAWRWLGQQLRQIELALPILEAVDDPRIVGAAVILWATATGQSFGGTGDGPAALVASAGEASAGEAERLGVSSLLALLRGSFGERACSQALTMLEDLIGSETLPVAPGRGRFSINIPQGLGAAMARRGLPDPVKLSATDGRHSAVALALIAASAVQHLDDETRIRKDDGQARATAPGAENAPENGAINKRSVTGPSTDRNISGNGFRGEIGGGGEDGRGYTRVNADVNGIGNGHRDAFRGSDAGYPDASHPDASPPQDPAAIISSLPSLRWNTPVLAALIHLATASPSPKTAGDRNAHGDDSRRSKKLLLCHTARRIIGQGCAALHDFLRSTGRARKDFGNDVDSAVGPTFSSGARGGSGFHAPWRESPVNATAVRALAPTLEAFLCFLETEIEDGGAGSGDQARQMLSQSSHHRQQQQQQQQQQLDQAESSQRSIASTTRRQVSDLLDLLYGLANGATGSTPDMHPTVDKCLMEVRGLCGEDKGQRAVASRRLAGLLRTETATGQDEGDVRPQLYLEDPLLLSSGGGGTGPFTGQSATAAATTAPAAEPPIFTSEHVRNLADVAGSLSLDAPLRRAGAEQLRAVLMSAGVADAVVAECQAEGGKDLCKVVLRAALSGILSSPTPREQTIPSYPKYTSKPVSVGHGDFRSEEAFLGLLWAVVWKFPSVRSVLLQGAALELDERVEIMGAESARTTVETARYQTSPVDEIPRGTGRTVGTGSTASSNGHSNGSTVDTRWTDKKAEAIDGASRFPPLVEVLRRLYHPRPSVRRLASRIAVLVAFDTPSFFAPLTDSSAFLKRGIGVDGSDCGALFASKSIGGGEPESLNGPAESYVNLVDGEPRSGGGLDVDCSHSDEVEGEGDLPGSRVQTAFFNVPELVMKAYPRLREWNSRSGDKDAPATATLTTSKNGATDAAGGSGENPKQHDLQKSRWTSKAFPDLGASDVVDDRREAVEDGRPGGYGSCVPLMVPPLFVIGGHECAEEGDGIKHFGSSDNKQSVLRVAAAERERLQLLRHTDALRKRRTQGGSPQASRGRDSEISKRAGPGDGTVVTTEETGTGVTPVIARLVEALQGAERRSEFASGLLMTRGWMLAGPGYKQELLGREGRWEIAFARFFQSPPSNTKDRTALRDVAVFLTPGTRHMSPRGFRAIADALEGCLVPILSEKWQPTLLGQYLLDWKAPSRLDTPREIEAKQRLREAILELLVAAVSSPRLDKGTAQALSTSSLPEVLWREFLERGGGREWEHDKGNGSHLEMARRLATDILTGIVKRGGSSIAISWAESVVMRRPTDKNNLRAAAGWGSAGGTSERSSLLTEIGKSLARHASQHHSPDGFRGRAELISSLVALQTVLSSASSAAAEAASTAGNDTQNIDTAVPMGREGSNVPGQRSTQGAEGLERRLREAVALGGDARETLSSKRGTGHKNIDGDVQSHDEPPRMDWLLRLGCHRDSSVRSLAFAILADLTPAGPQLSTGVSHVSGYAAFAGDDGVHGRDEAFAKVEEVGWSILGKGGTSSCSVGDISDGRSRAGGFVQSCVRAALDGTHESPAVMTEALRFLGRHMSTWSVDTRARKQLPPYAVPLTESLAQSAARLLLTPMSKIEGSKKNSRRRNGHDYPHHYGNRGDKVLLRTSGKSGAAGSLSVAAASLRFIVAITAVLTETPEGESSRAGSSEEREREEEGKGVEGETVRNAAGNGQEAQLAQLLETLWTSGCLESCVHVLGETSRGWALRSRSAGEEMGTENPNSDSSSRSHRDSNRWGRLLLASHDLEVEALRRAQGYALVLLRMVCCHHSFLTSPTRLQGPPSSLHSTGPPYSSSNINNANQESAPVTAAGARAGTEGSGVLAPRVALGVMVRQALLTGTPMLAGLVRSLVGAVEVISSRSSAPTAGAVQDEGSGGEGGRDIHGAATTAMEVLAVARVAGEACTTLGALLIVEAGTGTPSEEGWHLTPATRGGNPQASPASPQPPAAESEPRSAAITTPSLLSPAGSSRLQAQGLGFSPAMVTHPSRRDPRPVDGEGSVWERGKLSEKHRSEALPSPRGEVTMASDLLLPGSVIPQAVFSALAEILRWRVEDSRSGGEDGRAGVVVQVQSEAKRLLAIVLAVPRWRAALEFSGKDALSLTGSLVEEEARVLSSRHSQYQPQRRAAKAADELRARCLLPLLESSETLRGLALSMGLIGDLSVALASLLGQMATVGHGLDTIKTASKHLETLKAGMRAAASSIPSPALMGVAGGGSRSPLDKGSRGVADAAGGSGRKQKIKTKPPIPTYVKATGTTKRSPTRAATREIRTKSETGRSQTIVPRGGNHQKRGREAAAAGQAESAADDSATIQKNSIDTLTTSDPKRAMSRFGRDSSRTHGQVLEKEFQMAAALMVSTIGGFPPSQGEALRLRIPQLLWKAWPVALASQLSQNSSHASAVNRGSVSEAGPRHWQGGGVLLRAVLGLAAAISSGCEEGKIAFIFAGPEGAGNANEAGEWPRSSRSLLHRVAALALMGDDVGGTGRQGHGLAYPGHDGHGVSETACDVVRSCVLSSECRTVLQQSGFFADAVAQISQLCDGAGTSPLSSAFSRAARRASELCGVLVNGSLRTEGQRALLQIDGSGDMLGDLLSICLRRLSTNATGVAGQKRAFSAAGQGTRERDSNSASSLDLSTRVLLLARNLSLAPSTGQVAIHRDPLLDLILGTIHHPDQSLTHAAASCLRAVLRGGSNDGGGRTAVGAGGRTEEVAKAVNLSLRERWKPLRESSSESHGAVADEASRIRSTLLAVRELL